MELILDQLVEESELIRVMTFRSASGEDLPRYTAGAHIEFDLGDIGKRSYSLIDWPNAVSGFTIGVQREDAGQGGSQAMHKLRVGQAVEAGGPVNNFPIKAGAEPVLLLAGGIGITPIISMATALQQQGRPFQLHYTARNEARMGFAKPIEAAFSEATTFYLDDTNPLDLHQLMHSQEPGTQVYLCGPRGMIDTARTAATDAGVDEASITIELFSSAEQKNEDTAFEVEISSSGQVVAVAADQTIIEALESAGIDVMYDCQRGDCGICQCDVISGIPDHRDVVLSDAERASGKVIQICVSRANSPRLVIDV